MKKFLYFLIIGFVFLPVKVANASLLPDDVEWTKKIREGEFTLDDIIVLGFDLIQTLVELAGIFAVGMVMIGGYYYIIGSITDDKDKAKNIIKNALIGFTIAIMSWVIVEFVIRFFTT